MIVALDVHYDEDTLLAAGAAVVFEHWWDAAPESESTAVCDRVEVYVPGEFFRRELPILLAVLKQVAEPLDSIVIDGYVSLGDKPGLGMRLWDALGEKTPIIGVAKTRYQGAEPTEVFRGQSRIPLYVTAAGTDIAEAAVNVARMAGPYRVPTLLKSVDRLARDRLKQRLSQQSLK